MPENFKSEKAILHSNSAIVLIKMKRYDEAEAECTTAIDLNPTLVKAIANRAECLFQSKNYQKSLEGELIRLGNRAKTGPTLSEQTEVPGNKGIGSSRNGKEEGRSVRVTQNTRKLVTG